MIKYGIELKIILDGASPEEIERGEAAAWAVFEAAGVNPWATAAAVLKQEAELEDITIEEAQLADIWRTAWEEADAACRGPEGKPPRVDIHLLSGMESILDGSTHLPTSEK